MDRRRLTSEYYSVIEDLASQYVDQFLMLEQTFGVRLPKRAALAMAFINGFGSGASQQGHDELCYENLRMRNLIDACRTSESDTLLESALNAIFHIYVQHQIGCDCPACKFVRDTVGKAILEKMQSKSSRN